MHEAFFARKFDYCFINNADNNSVSVRYYWSSKNTTALFRRNNRLFAYFFVPLHGRNSTVHADGQRVPNYVLNALKIREIGRYNLKEVIC